jgi:hypothetical protein
VTKFDIELDAQVRITKRVDAEDEETAISEAIEQLEFDVIPGELYNARPVNITEV